VLFATLLALAAAGLHATWNLLVKTSAARDLAAWGQFTAGALVFLPVLLVTGAPAGTAVPFLVVSSIVHVGYVGALTAAYHYGDFSLAYPMSRGLGACAAAVGGLVFLGDGLSPGGWAALAIVGAGLVALARPGATATSVAWAATTGLVIGTYTVVDAAGSRHTDGLAYGICLTAGAAVALSVAGAATGRLPAFVASWRSDWSRYLVSGVCLTGAYSLVLVAVHHAPVGYVATLRESSVVLGAGAGWLLLHERLGAARLAAAGVVAFGLVLLVVLR
jgi:drug/metabolite transporter (DMT)-like permease